MIRYRIPIITYNWYCKTKVAAFTEMIYIDPIVLRKKFVMRYCYSLEENFVIV